MTARIAASFVDVDRPLRGLLDLAATWKLDGVQLDTRLHVRPADFGETARRQLRHYLSERRLALSGLFVPTRSPLAELDHLDRRLGAITAAMPLAFDLAATAVVVPLGTWPTEDEDRERLRRVLEELAAASDRFGPRLTLVPSAGSIAPLAELIAETGAPIEIQFDPTAAVFAREKLEPAVRSLHEQTTQLRVRDGQAGGHETVVGRGEVDWELLAAASHEIRSLQWLVVDRTEGGQRAIDLQNAIGYTRAVFQP